MNTRSSLVLAVLAAWLGSPEPVRGQTIETVIPDFVATCTSTGELCEPPFDVPVQTGSVLQAQYTVRATHCASVRVHFLVDGALVASSGFLGWPGAPLPFSALPLDTGLVDLGPVAPGAHVLGVQAEGQVGGCNSGNLTDWGGSLRVLTSPPIAEVQVDVKPGSAENPINPRSRGVIPVAILTGGGFDATTVDPATVRFGHTGSEAAPVHSFIADADLDGDIDLFVFFKTPDTKIQCGDVSALLTGMTRGGQRIRGADAIRTVGCK